MFELCRDHAQPIRLSNIFDQTKYRKKDCAIILMGSRVILFKYFILNLISDMVDVLSQRRAIKPIKLVMMMMMMMMMMMIMLTITIMLMLMRAMKMVMMMIMSHFNIV